MGSVRLPRASIAIVAAMVALCNLAVGPSWVGALVFGAAYLFVRRKAKLANAAIILLALLISSAIKTLVLGFLFGLSYCDYQRLSTGPVRFIVDWDVPGAREQQIIRALRDSSPTWDAFACGPARTTGGLTYSIGPDGIDDGMLVPYDPSNGTLSRGDVLIVRSAAP